MKIKLFIDGTEATIKDGIICVKSSPEKCIPISDELVGLVIDYVWHKGGRIVILEE